jgi:hypothetical protein
MLGDATAIVWRTLQWLSRWVPLALLACASAAATLYIARFGARLRYAEHWGLALIGLSALSAIGAVRRARGLPVSAAPPRRQRLAPALIVAVIAGVFALELIAFLVRVAVRDYDERRWGPVPFGTFVLELIPDVALCITVSVMAGCLAASAYVLRPSAGRALMLISTLGLGLGVQNRNWLRSLANVPADWPGSGLIIGALIGLTVAITFWTLGGVAAAASLERKHEHSPVSPSYSKMSPAGWAGFRRAVCLSVAIPLGIMLLSPVPFFYPMVAVLAEGAPVYVLVLLGLFLTCASTASAAKRFRAHDIRAYSRGKRIGICTVVLFVNVMWALPPSVWMVMAEVLVPRL